MAAGTAWGPIYVESILKPPRHFNLRLLIHFLENGRSWEHLMLEYWQRGSRRRLFTDRMTPFELRVCLIHRDFYLVFHLLHSFLHFFCRNGRRYFDSGSKRASWHLVFPGVWRQSRYRLWIRRIRWAIRRRINSLLSDGHVLRGSLKLLIHDV